MDIERIYREIAPKLQSYLTGSGCSYATSCDIVQETFLRMWKMRDELSDDFHQISGLAFSIARNYRNDLARKSQHETLGGESSVEEGDSGADAARADVRPGEKSEETEALKRRLKSTLGRMPVQLLEIFALSRLGNLTVKDIASGTGVSEANVKVRVHRARDLFRTCFGDRVESGGGSAAPMGPGIAVLRAMMMLAAVDGEIAKEELSLYRGLADELRGEAVGEGFWEGAVRAMAYVGFLSEMLSPEELVREYARETREVFAAEGGGGPENRRRILAALERMASVDGDYSRIERACVNELSDML